MRHGIAVVPFGLYADPNYVVQLGQAAEAAGWESLFVWDHLAFTIGIPSGDPWVILSAIAQATDKIKIGTGVTPLPRYRPHVLANLLTTLDLLSNGRLIFGAGLGAIPQEFSAYGEDSEAKPRAIMLDEGLEIINQMMSGNPVNYQGQYYSVDNITLAPLPIQQPRVPIWIGGESPPALRRAARWDGWVIGVDDEQGNITKTPDELREQVSLIHSLRSDPNLPYEVALMGQAFGKGQSMTSEYESAGATWWLEIIAPLLGSHEEMLERIHVGPAFG
jgi:alkanesulfonate monooxygenase SsuD/methylene tetrahydromethanopterin reductase-like flavin-dependent oxidoreductase (luciferase family)